MQGAIDVINVNLSQRDLKSLISVWQDNISKIPLLRKAGENDDRTSTQSSQKSIDNDVMVQKLEDFLTHNETALCEVNVKLTLEGLQLNLFMDTEEVDIHISAIVRCFFFYFLHHFCRVTGVEFSRARFESRFVQAVLRRNHQHLGFVQRQELEDEIIFAELLNAGHS